MNDDHKHHDLERLRLATARALPADAALDAETAALREGFLALGAALDAANVDSPALVVQPALRPAAAAAILNCHPRDGASHSALYGLALVAAAAALLAIVRTLAPLPAEQPLHQPAIARSEGTDAHAADNPAAANLPVDRGRWSDPLDVEIALAQAEFQQLGARDRGVDGSLSRMNERLEALSQELFLGSL